MCLKSLLFVCVPARREPSWVGVEISCCSVIPSIRHPSVEFIIIHPLVSRLVLNLYGGGGEDEVSCLPSMCLAKSMTLAPYSHIRSIGRI